MGSTSRQSETSRRDGSRSVSDNHDRDTRDRLKKYRTRVNAYLADYNLAAKQAKEEKEALIEAEEQLASIEEAQSIIQQIAQKVQQHAHRQIASVVTRCLETVFDDPYQFQIEFERKRGQTEARLVLVRDKLEADPETATGGGVVDIAAFALRLAALLLAQPRARRLLVLDEAFRYVSADYRPRVRALLKTLAKEMNVQFILVTHSQELQIGKVIEL